MTNFQIKQSARELASKHWKELFFLVAVHLIVGVINANAGPVMILVTTCAMFVINYIWIVVALKIAREEEVVWDVNLFESKTFVTWVAVSFVTGLYTLLWTLIPIVGLVLGPIKSMAYAQAPYLAIDNPDKKTGELIKESIRLMDGYKLPLFWIVLSLIGWGILTALTLGIASFYTIPYMNFVYTLFYIERIKN